MKLLNLILQLTLKGFSIQISNGFEDCSISIYIQKGIQIGIGGQVQSCRIEMSRVEINSTKVDSEEIICMLILEAIKKFNF